MKQKWMRLAACLAVLMLLISAIPVAVFADTHTVESVTAQLQAIDSLQTMQNKRANYTASKHYDTTTTNQSIINAHLKARQGYETYVAEMFAARAAAQAAYDSLTPEEQAQIDPALVAKLTDTLSNAVRYDTLPVTPRYDEYIFETVGDPDNEYNALGYVYEVSHAMVGGEIPQTFVLVDTSDGKTQWTPSGLYEQGVSNYDVAYCCDIETGLAWGHDYRRINLEDAGYFSKTSAEHIRAIVSASYPYVSIDQMKANMKAQGLNAAYVDSLSRSDIIAGVQMAIWYYSIAGEMAAEDAKYFADISVTKNIGIYFTPIHDYTSELWQWLPAGGQRSYDPKSAPRINNLIYCLCNLPPQKAAEASIVISEIQVGRVDLIPGDNNLYNLGLHVLLNGTPGEEDNIILRVTSYSTDSEGNQVKTDTAAIRAEYAREFGLSINARYGDTIAVEVEGTQYMPEDVYFYEAEGGPKVSQSLVGISSGSAPVYAVQTFPFEEDIDAGLRIYKKSSVDKAPISDITFDIYRVDPADGEELSDEPTAAEIARYAVEKNLVGSVVTDSTGYACLTLGKGTYMIVERHNKDKVKQPAAPFYITLPYPVEKEENGETVIEYLDIVSVYPKNTPTTPPPPPPPPPPPAESEGQFQIIKHDSNDQTNVLEGARFRVYRPATAEDTDTETLICGGKTLAVVPVTVDGQQLTMITDANGTALSPMLPCGIYYIKETKAPAGYILPLEAVSVTVQPDVVEEVTYVYVSNDRGVHLPETGGIGTTTLLVTGGLLCMVALLFLITKKRLAAHRF
jgi:LPXTG-motif cell wall-anchored protein